MTSSKHNWMLSACAASSPDTGSGGFAACGVLLVAFEPSTVGCSGPVVLELSADAGGAVSGGCVLVHVGEGVVVVSAVVASAGVLCGGADEVVVVAVEGPALDGVDVGVRPVGVCAINGVVLFEVSVLGAVPCLEPLVVGGISNTSSSRSEWRGDNSREGLL